MALVVADTAHALDDLGDAAERPQLGSEAACARTLEESPFHLAQFVLAQPWRPARSARAAQRVHAPAVPGVEPPAHRLPRRAQTPGYLGLRHTALEQLRRLPAPPLQRLSILLPTPVPRPTRNRRFPSRSHGHIVPRDGGSVTDLGETL